MPSSRVWKTAGEPSGVFRRRRTAQWWRTWNAKMQTDFLGKTPGKCWMISCLLIIILDDLDEVLGFEARILMEHLVLCCPGHRWDMQVTSEHHFVPTFRTPRPIDFAVHRGSARGAFEICNCERPLAFELPQFLQGRFVLKNTYVE